MVRESTVQPPVMNGSTDGDVYHVSGEPVAEAVVRATSDAAGVDPSEGTPLYEVIDPAVLEALVRPETGPDAGRARVTFEFHGREITVWENGAIRVRDPPPHS